MDSKHNSSHQHSRPTYEHLVRKPSDAACHAKDNPVDDVAAALAERVSIHREFSSFSTLKFQQEI